MHLIKYRAPDGTSGLAVSDADGFTPLRDASDLSTLLREPLSRIRAAVEEAAAGPRLTADGLRLLPPADGRMEVWGAGVTYERSRSARIEESGKSDVYGAVYQAERPELFFKSAPWRALTDGDTAGLRADAESTVPEPELALVVNRFGEIVAATGCDDLTARSIEGENPLYLPQAKTYIGSCVLGPRLRPWWEIADPAALAVTLSILRSGTEVFAGRTSTSRLHRSYAELVSWLCRATDFPDGAVLATGTGIVPEADFSLESGDTVRIDIEQVGALEHTVVRGPA
ncbi:2-dehydro-3-deoxy-D-arabinonate dehydratase [Actinacidiphila yanglinensis]|uniref:2-dehydro-3-deoxy-D-arabinonate dehydratase n=1 Tax=Actinacidiphila yanglinensis TaxID=310779 RepID=A0A1H6E8G3_9ACTN|nr:fumarylacetoacetate hydrolase family protein [Actinacidiphila yanglinensis]SEG93135.1 2-dehydro-3-deoxy-D-arabinonate dehydratase [Actinacidiphila yanglinensis]